MNLLGLVMIFLQGLKDNAQDRLDYFMNDIACGIGESLEERLAEDDYGCSVWTEKQVTNFLESHLGLSEERRIKGSIVPEHIEVIHIDSHADLGLGYSS